MIRKMIFLAVACVAVPLFSSAQDCKVKFAVVYADGESLQTGLTPEQKKMWEHDAAKKYKRMCLDEKDPNYLVLWSEGLSGAELSKVSLSHFNSVRTTGQVPGPSVVDTHSSVMSRTIHLKPSSQVRARADYFVFDMSKNPYVLVRQGQGYQDVPQGGSNRPNEKLGNSDIASTIADPAAALENALKWLKKENKL